MKKRLISLFLVGFFIMSLCTAVNADLKAGFMQRKGTIDSMKSRGIIGENNLGYLDYRGPSRENKHIVDAETHGLPFAT